jgi:FixJ family two-component response regulator
MNAPSVLDLTERELEVLQMKCTTGKTAAEVAFELNIGEQTVKTHLQHASAWTRPNRRASCSARKCPTYEVHAPRVGDPALPVRTRPVPA